MPSASWIVACWKLERFLRALSAMTVLAELLDF